MRPLKKYHFIENHTLQTRSNFVPPYYAIYTKHAINYFRIFFLYLHIILLTNNKGMIIMNKLDNINIFFDKMIKESIDKDYDEAIIKNLMFNNDKYKIIKEDFMMNKGTTYELSKVVGNIYTLHFILINNKFKYLTLIKSQNGIIETNEIQSFYKYALLLRETTLRETV